MAESTGMRLSLCAAAILVSKGIDITNSKLSDLENECAATNRPERTIQHMIINVPSSTIVAMQIWVVAAAIALPVLLSSLGDGSVIKCLLC